MDDSLSLEGFRDGARRFVDLAMAARARLDHEMFALLAGVAVERLAKATLARRNPALLVEMKGSAEMLLHVTGIKDAKRVRTIGASEAVRRLREGGILPQHDPKLDLLVELRNGVAHSSGSETTDDLLPKFAETVDTLLADLGEDRDEFWGDWHGTATMAISEEHSKVTRDTQMRIEHARHLFADQIPGLRSRGTFREFRSPDPNELQGVETHFARNGMTWTTMVKCPACGGEAKETKIVMAADIDDDRALVTPRLECKYCWLTLHGHQEMEAAGFDSIREVDVREDSHIASTIRDFVKYRLAFDEQERDQGFPDLREASTWLESPPYADG